MARKWVEVIGVLIAIARILIARVANVHFRRVAIFSIVNIFGLKHGSCSRAMYLFERFGAEHQNAMTTVYSHLPASSGLGKPRNNSTLNFKRIYINITILEFDCSLYFAR
jgi:hypothetical protein